MRDAVAPLLSMRFTMLRPVFEYVGQTKPKAGEQPPPFKHLLSGKDLYSGWRVVDVELLHLRSYQPCPQIGDQSLHREFQGAPALGSAGVDRSACPCTSTIGPPLGTDISAGPRKKCTVAGVVIPPDMIA